MGKEKVIRAVDSIKSPSIPALPIKTKYLKRKIKGMKWSIENIADTRELCRFKLEGKKEILEIEERYLAW